MTDTECMCVLQGKSLSKDTSDVVFTTSRTTKGEFAFVCCKSAYYIFWYWDALFDDKELNKNLDILCTRNRLFLYVKPAKPECYHIVRELRHCIL